MCRSIVDFRIHAEISEVQTEKKPVVSGKVRREAQPARADEEARSSPPSVSAVRVAAVSESEYCATAAVVDSQTAEVETGPGDDASEEGIGGLPEVLRKGFEKLRQNLEEDGRQSLYSLCSALDDCVSTFFAKPLSAPSTTTATRRCDRCNLCCARRTFLSVCQEYTNNGRGENRISQPRQLKVSRTTLGLEGFSDRLEAVMDNLAVGRPAWQSSTFGGDTGAEKAVDGNTNTDFGVGLSCSHTDTGPAWWMVDLQREVRVSNVVLYNRALCCSERLAKFHLQLHQKNPQICGNVTMVTSVYQDAALPAGPTTFTFDPARTARWVQVVMPGIQSILTLCEVQVFGEPLTSAGPCAHCQSSPVVLPQLPPLTTHASLSVGNASPALCASLCLRHGQCLGFFFRPVVGGPPTCTLLVPRPPGALVEAGLPGTVTYFEMTC